MVEVSPTCPGAATEATTWFDLEVGAQRVAFGAGRVRQVPDELAFLGLERVLLVATRSARRTVEALAAALGPAVVARITEVVQHVPESAVGRALDLCAESGAHGVLTLGGGSAVGLGKAVAVHTGLPLVAVPTTYAGSEATPVYGVTGKHKRTGRDPRALPRAVVYDPELTLTMPPRVTATSGLNAVAHCVEALYAPGANPVTALFAREGIRLLAQALPVAVARPADLSARTGALHAAHLAGWSLATAGSALHHTVCHVLGGSYALGHAELHSVLLPYVAAYNAPAAPDAMAAVAQALGTSDAPSGLRRLAENLGAPVDLASLGLPESALDDVVTRAVGAVGGRNPRTVDAASLRRLLDDAYAGKPPGHY